MMIDGLRAWAHM